MFPDLDPGFEIFADLEPVPVIEIKLIQGLIFSKKLCFLREKVKKKTLDPDPGTPKISIRIQELQKCGSSTDPGLKPGITAIYKKKLEWTAMFATKGLAQQL